VAKSKPMSFLKRIIMAIPLQPFDLKKVFSKKPNRQKLIDAGLIVLISFMIVIYKAYKHNTL
jgi:hypothetical protein